MEIMVDNLGYIEEEESLAENVERRSCEKRYVAEALTGVLIARND